MQFAAAAWEESGGRPLVEGIDSRCFLFFIFVFVVGSPAQVIPLLLSKKKGYTKKEMSITFGGPTGRFFFPSPVTHTKFLQIYRLLAHKHLKVSKRKKMLHLMICYISFRLVHPCGRCEAVPCTKPGAYIRLWEGNRFFWRSQFIICASKTKKNLHFLRISFKNQNPEQTVPTL